MAIAGEVGKNGLKGLRLVESTTFINGFVKASFFVICRSNQFWWPGIIYVFFCLVEGNEYDCQKKCCMYKPVELLAVSKYVHYRGWKPTNKTCTEGFQLPT